MDGKGGGGGANDFSLCYYVFDLCYGGQLFGHGHDCAEMIPRAKTVLNVAAKSSDLKICPICLKKKFHPVWGISAKTTKFHPKTTYLITSSLFRRKIHFHYSLELQQFGGVADYP